MPQISVSTVQFFKAGPDGLPVDDELQLSSVDKRFPDLRFPAKGRTFLYGHANPGVNYLVNMAAAVELESAPTEISVEIENWVKHKIRLSAEPGRGIFTTRFLSLSRATKEVIELIQEICDKPNSPMFTDNGRVKFPERLDLLMDNEFFKHLWVIAYTVETQAIGAVQVATLFNEDAVVEIATSPQLEEIDLYF